MEALNGGLLPEGYYALSEQHAGQVVPDVLTLSTRTATDAAPRPDGVVAVAEAPPRVQMRMVAGEDATYRMARRTLAIRHRSGRRLVAMVEIVSPGNKDGRQHVEQFVDKAVAALQHGIHLLVVDLLPASPEAAAGMHGAIWEIVGGEFELSDPHALALAAYIADRMPQALVNLVHVGSVLPEMPLFLSIDWYINLPLEPSYMAAYRGLPGIVRDVVEGRAPAETKRMR
jgi:hypothetical protein